MKPIHFTSRTINDGEEVYTLTIEGENWEYDRDTDFLENKQTGDLIERADLPGDILRAFHQAWNPDYYAACSKETPTLYGIPDSAEDPTSPLYNPVRPSGYPAELRQQLETQDAAHNMAALLAAYCTATGVDGPDDATCRRAVQAINAVKEQA